MKIIFIRHGETTGDVEGRYGGAYDDGLSEVGLRQAAELAEELRGKGIKRVVTSGLLRARQTGAVVAKALGVLAFSDAGFSERNQYGALSGMEKTEARARYPELVEGLKDRLFTAPGGESYEDFRARIAAGFQDLMARNEDGVAVVWHGGAMRVLFRDILKLGELMEIGDCCWVELDMATGKVGDFRRIGFDFQV